MGLINTVDKRKKEHVLYDSILYGSSYIHIMNVACVGIGVGRRRKSMIITNWYVLFCRIACTVEISKHILYALVQIK